MFQYYVYKTVKLQVMLFLPTEFFLPAFLPVFLPRVVSTNLSAFHLPPQVLKSSLIGCRSWKNLAEWLAEKNLFWRWNADIKLQRCRNKRKLNKTKTSAIRRACMSDFPLRGHENGYIVERDIREGVDEMGWGIKQQKIIRVGKENFDA